jgi:hypothetical protein
MLYRFGRINYQYVNINLPNYEKILNFTAKMCRKCDQQSAKLTTRIHYINAKKISRHTIIREILLQLAVNKCKLKVIQDRRRSQEAQGDGLQNRYSAVRIRPPPCKYLPYFHEHRSGARRSTVIGRNLNRPSLVFSLSSARPVY